MFIELSSRYHWCVLSGKMIPECSHWNICSVSICHNTVLSREFILKKLQNEVCAKRHNGNEILGWPISMQVWAYEISCSNCFSEREKEGLNYIVFCHIQFAQQRKSHGHQLWPFEPSNVVKHPAELLPDWSFLLILINTLVYWKRKQLLWNRFQTANPSRLSVLPSRICF